MSRRKPDPNPHVLGLDRAALLIVASRRGQREQLAARLRTALGRVEACTPEQALRLARDFDLVLIDCPHAVEAWRRLAPLAPGASGIALRKDPEPGFLLQALRAGLDDVFEPGDDAELLGALARAFERAQRRDAGLVRERRRTRRLRTLCGGLLRSRGELMRQMGDLCADMSASYRDISEQLTGVTVGAELSAVLRQELELEGLLRTTLEFTLAKVGPTNAAIFLPNALGDYSLGAYVNYDCSKDSCESMLEDFAGVAAGAFQERTGPIALKDAREIEVALGRHTSWLDDAGMVATPCRANGESVAVAVFFRDRRTPFSPFHGRCLGLIADVFAAQLSRVIRTHNRCAAKDKWGADGLGPDDLAA